MAETDLNIYEAGTLECITGATLRPGGLILTQRAVSFCQFQTAAKILDIGCGTGETVRFLIEKCHLDALGLDSSQVMIQKGKSKSSRLPLFHGSGENLPFPNYSMDGVFMECSFGLIADKHALLAEIFRVLNDQGKLVISDIYYRNRPGTNTQATISALITDHGFKLELWEDHSDYLAQLAAESIMKYGSTDTLWSCLLGKAENQGATRPQIKSWKPGYYLLIASKQTDE